MELVKKAEKRDHEIVYSRAVKAGKRIYYLDVKRNRRNDLFLCITESKKIVWGNSTENQQVQFEKHKIFLYKEDFEKFADGLTEVINFIKNESPTPLQPRRVIEKRVNTMERDLQNESITDSISELDNEPFFQLNLEELDA